MKQSIGAMSFKHNLLALVTVLYGASAAFTDGAPRFWLFCCVIIAAIMWGKYAHAISQAERDNRELNYH